MAEWIIEKDYHWVTPGGDPTWKCSNCGGGKHVFGIESMESQPKICSDCGETMTNAKEVIILPFPIFESNRSKRGRRRDIKE